MRRLKDFEIYELEQPLNTRFPAIYRKLLMDIGYGSIGDEVEIHDPLKVPELFESFFDQPEQLFNPYFPFGCNNKFQEIWVIDGSKALAASVWHETVPEDWDEEAWIDFDLWSKRHLRDYF